MIASNIQEKINKHLLERLQLAFIRVDHSMRVRETSESLADYGFGEIPTGSDVTDYLDFMVGMDSHQPLELPMVTSPSGIPVTVSLIPDSEQLTVLISNASAQAGQRQQLQQAANENELLVDQQKRLMAELELASRELESKNGQLKEASRLQTSFLSGVSHEFRTPLTSIIGYTNLLRHDMQNIGQSSELERVSEKDKASYLRAVRRSSKHLLSLVENLLDHGKLDANEIVIRPKATDLEEVFEDVEILLQPLCVTKGIELFVVTDFPEKLSAVIDASRLRQCLINLVGNAVKFTDQGSVNVEAIWSDEVLSIKIEDSGLGISAEDLQKIRLPFWQAPETGKAGTGLGLTITEKIIELMGGHLNIRSELGVGTCVSFELAVPELSKSADILGLQSVEGLQVLLAEDDSDIADLVSMMFLERGVVVTHVENGALALDALQAKQFDLVLMDIHMPIMTGYEAVAGMRARGDDTPVVIMSASALDNDRTRAEQLGCNGYVMKPVEIDDLLAIATQVIS